MTKSQWKKRPQMAPATRRAKITSLGMEIADNKPHPLLLASPHIPTLQEQVESMTRLGSIRRMNILDNLPDDYYAEDLEDDYNSEGLSPYEVEGAKKFWDDNSVKSQHKTPDAGVSGEQTPTTTSGKDGGAAPNVVEPS